MRQLSHTGIGLDTPAVYRIRCRGELDTSWSEYLSDMTIATSGQRGPQAVTTLVGRLPDQAALFGVLNALYSLGLALVLVELIDAPTFAERTATA